MQVFQRSFLLSDSNPSVLSRNARIVERNHGVGISPEDIVTLLKGNLSAFPKEGPGTGRLARFLRVTADNEFRAEGVAESVHRANESRAPAVIMQRRSHFSDQTRQIGFRNKRLGPELFIEIVLRNRVRAPLHQDLQQKEGFGREVDFLVASEELALIRVEQKLGEPYSRHALFQSPREETNRLYA